MATLSDKDLQLLAKEGAKAMAQTLKKSLHTTQSTPATSSLSTRKSKRPDSDSDGRDRT